MKVSRRGVEVRTGGGLIKAQRVIIATGYPRRFRGLVGRFKMKDTFVVATRRLPKRLRSRASPPMAWDTNRPYHYLRWTEDGRLLIGGGDVTHRSVKGSRKRIARATSRLLKYLAQVHPELADERPEYAWEGLFAETPDGLPYIGTHSRFPGHLFALGYGGNGMTASFLAARLLLDLYQSRDRQPPMRRTNANLFAFRRGHR